MVVTRPGMKEAQVGTCAIKQIEVWSPFINLFFFRKYTLPPANLQIFSVPPRFRLGQWRKHTCNPIRRRIRHEIPQKSGSWISVHFPKMDHRQERK